MTNAPTPPATRLAELRAKFPDWTIDRAPGRAIGYTATLGDHKLYSPHLTGLEARLTDAERGG